MKKITVFHWCGELKDLRNTYAEHKAEVDYTIQIRNTIINLIMDKGYNVMLLQNDNGLTIGVDTKRFQQR